MKVLNVPLPAEQLRSCKGIIISFGRHGVYDREKVGSDMSAAFVTLSTGLKIHHEDIHQAGISKVFKRMNIALNWSLCAPFSNMKWADTRQLLHITEPNAQFCNDHYLKKIIR